jgi:hypothetical protein
MKSYSKNVLDKEYKKLEKWYSEMLEEKDKEIDRLKEENAILLRSALKQAEVKVDWEKSLKKSAKRK